MHNLVVVTEHSHIPLSPSSVLNPWAETSKVKFSERISLFCWDESLYFSVELACLKTEPMETVSSSQSPDAQTRVQDVIIEKGSLNMKHLVEEWLETGVGWTCPK
ncbi:hypothetical protein NPIL_674211 [Nephila pilipes]|uniref:Uncharacterized protein n=1 Tax=Nephila pilipes TaxID=299642 RepID=A0A8X6QQK1_NEPPI|nr:hypothetical protein NPIL_674211 [Nephila pilipes]